MNEVEKKIYDMQSPQTKRLMDIQRTRPQSADASYKREKALSPVPEKAQVLKEDGSIDLNVREISQKEYDEFQAFRYRRGKLFEEVRTAYLKKMAAEGKIHVSLMNHIETDHVMPPEPVRERAEKAYMGKLAGLKEKFKNLMESIFKPTPTHAEIISEALKKAKE